MKVLVTDDSTTMRRIIRSVLEQIGITDVTEASNGREAVAAAGHRDVRLILLDWNMPEMSGLEALRAIRDSGNRSPIIMVTTEAERKRIIEAVQAGCSDYLIKPFTPDALVARIQKHLPGAAQVSVA